MCFKISLLFVIAATAQIALAQSVRLHLTDNQVAELNIAKLDSITFTPANGNLLVLPAVSNSIFVSQGKKIIVTGASFAGSNNGWDKLVQDMTGIEVINMAQGGTNIMRNMAERMLDADSAMPHGSLFLSNGHDIFDEVGAIIIFHSHNYNVLLNEEDYQSRTAGWYKDHMSEATDEKKYDGAFDYVIKQIKEWNPDMQILICSHWLPSRTIYNTTSRELAHRHKVAYCPLDAELGFTAEELVRTTTGIDGRIEPTEDNYNRSVLHSQFVGISKTTGKPHGKTERINGVVWGWHPMIVNDSINYGCGTMVSRDNKVVFVPWIQNAIASAISKSIITTYDE